MKQKIYDPLSVSFIRDQCRAVEETERRHIMQQQVSDINCFLEHQGPVVQSIVSLTTSLRCQLVKYMPTKLSNTLLFLLEKCAKDSHIFSTKNNSVFVIYTFENLTKH